ncbi:DEAD-box ATP-dependent RNA helicase 42 [Monomorium pharaonis]|uniref:DEAD-box ATP-dependent RNA helicase 42 n=1 Tax=Monomorium pharaonis TaxID=307658 RepID=UPI00102E19D1|nr:DEAD-box ATP-dependent RNA helicase 42 [Monomorium pharaonis]XP_036145436.1 DEAD-box ATP-dependent RNA helicase 42 [Monomorium pharaonis]XP_036145437.1 DEAD-box ATP-dependent RNA helicase 42 [Monomorium pharaonis]
MNLRLIATDDTGTIFENCYGYHIDSRMRTSSSKSTKTCDNRQRDIEVASREVDSTRIGRPIGSGIETGHRCDEIIDEDLSSEANGSRSLGRGKTETSAGGARSDDGTRNTDTVAERIREKRDNNPHQRELEGEVEDKNRQDRRSAQRDVQEETNRSQIAAEKRRAGRDTGDAMAAAVAAVEEKKEGEKKVEGDGERRNPGENPYQQCRGKERETRLSDSNAEKIDRLDRVEERSVRMETSRKPAKRLERDEHGRRDQRENEKNPAARQNRKKEERDKDGEADATPLSKSKDPASKRTTDSPGDAEKGRSALNEEGKLPVSNRRHKEASTERGSGSKETGERTAGKCTLIQNTAQIMKRNETLHLPIRKTKLKLVRLT